MAATLDDVLAELEKITYNTTKLAQNKRKIFEIDGSMDFSDYTKPNLFTYEVLTGSFIWTPPILTGTGTILVEWRE